MCRKPPLPVKVIKLSSMVFPFFTNRDHQFDAQLTEPRSSAHNSRVSRPRKDKTAIVALLFDMHVSASLVARATSG